MNGTGYKEGGGHWDPWWRQAAPNKNMRAMLKEILEAARERQQRESDRCGGGKGWEEDTESDSNG